MAMKPLDQIEGHEIWKNLKKNDDRYEEYHQKVGQQVYKGKYNAIYMDEIMCTDHSLQSKEFQEIQLNGRYGNFDDESLAKLRTLTASENDLKDPE